VEIVMDRNDSKGNGAKGDLIDLQGREIRRVKDGLDEAQVVSVINELISERDRLVEQTSHLSGLTRLAENTVLEAEKLAEQMKVEAIEQAKAEAEAQSQQLESENKRIQLEMRNVIDGLCRQLVSEPESFAKRITDIWMESEQKLTQVFERTGPATHTEHDNLSSAENGSF
jgi:hypothetical protein